MARKSICTPLSMSVVVAALALLLGCGSAAAASAALGHNREHTQMTASRSIIDFTRREGTL